MKLEQWRKEIDEIDGSMAELFGKRMAIVEKIGVYKKKNGLPIDDKKRESEVIEKNLARMGKPEYERFYIEFMNHLFSLTKRLEDK